MNVREGAAKVLVACEQKGAFSNLEIKHYAKDMSHEDAALLKAIINGTLQKLRPIDYVLSTYIKKGFAGQRPLIKALLRCAVYQILFMDKVPDSAACNEAVKLTKKLVSPSLGGFVNGTLRSIIRNKEEISGWNEIISPLFAYPEAVTDIFVRSYGEETAKYICKALQDPIKTSVVLNTYRYTAEEISEMIENDGISVDGDGFLNKGTDLSSCSSFEKGAFFVQGLSSSAICSLLSPKENETILDACGAPGGKTYNMAIHCGCKANFITADISESRAGLIKDGAQRLGLKNITIITADASKPLPTGDKMFDKILCDVPCSGLGSIRKKRDILLNLSDHIKNLPEIQYRILENCAGYLKKGGLLLYSTCTLNRDENENVVDRFLQEHPNFEFSPPPSRSFESMTCIICDKYVTILPCVKYDGFFAALLRRK